MCFRTGRAPFSTSILLHAGIPAQAHTAYCLFFLWSQLRRNSSTPPSVVALCRRKASTCHLSTLPTLNPTLEMLESNIPNVRWKCWIPTFPTLDPTLEMLDSNNSNVESNVENVGSQHSQCWIQRWECWIPTIPMLSQTLEMLDSNIPDVESNVGNVGFKHSKG